MFIHDLGQLWFKFVNTADFPQGYEWKIQDFKSVL